MVDDNLSRRSRLRCSISGGLEELAEKEAQKLGLQINWSKRGQQGSRLEILLKGDEQQTNSIVQVLQQMHYVEYVYLEVLNTRISFDTKETLLYQVEERISTAISEGEFDKSLDVGRASKALLRDQQDVGLEPLPGVLLPTPYVAEDWNDPSTSTSDQAIFIVNTVYTKPAAAKAVVDIYLQLAEKHSLDQSILHVDAGAGAGALLKHLPAGHRVGIDLQPAHPEVQEMDFFHLSKATLIEQFPNHNVDICVISNPPFAERSRGDYSGIVKFINHSFTHLQAANVGVIVPSQFCRQRVWQSLGMHHRVKLLVRFRLPDNSFYDPSSATCRNINAMFLFFGLAHDDATKENDEDEAVDSEAPGSEVAPNTQSTFQVEGKRNKGDFPWLRTAEFVKAIAKGLDRTKVDKWVIPSSERLVLSAEISALDETTAQMELHVLLNPKQPLSLVNCVSRRISAHSLGWLSMSAKPPIALAMCNLALTNEKVAAISSKRNGVNGGSNNGRVLAINIMCGEGTIELESRQLSESFFLIAGDKSEEAARNTAARLTSLQKQKGGSRRQFPLLDLVIWDAQRLPLRSDIADILIADLPFGGSQAKKHQEPTLSGKAVDSLLSYKHLMAQAVRVLRCGGRGSFLSADTKALSYAALNFNGRLSVLWRNNVNLGGLAGKLMLLEKSKQCTKDISIWTSGHADLSQTITRLSIVACAGFWLNELLEMKENLVHASEEQYNAVATLVLGVQLISTFSPKHSNSKDLVSHCYRICFDSRVSNGQAKTLEKVIRARFDDYPPDGMQLR